MGSTLEAQKKKAPKPKTQTRKKEIVVTPGKPYYSSKSLRKGFEQRLPSADMSAQLRQTSPLGRMSPRAAVLDVTAKAMDLFRGAEGKRGARHAENVAEYMNKNDGGMAYKTRRF
jgi:hypothetical protein